MHKVLCHDCKHRRSPYQPRLFNQRDVMREAGLKAMAKRDEREARRASQEERMFDQRMDFEGKPHNYFWCNAMTPCERDFMKILADHMYSDFESAQDLRKAALAISTKLQQLIDRAEVGDRGAQRDLLEIGLFDGVRGDIIKLYAICEAVNNDFQCPIFEKRED